MKVAVAVPVRNAWKQTGKDTWLLMMTSRDKRFKSYDDMFAYCLRNNIHPIAV